MIVLAFDDRRPSRTRSRPWRFAGLAAAVLAALSLAACQRADRLTGRDAELALDALRAAPEHGFAADRFPAQRIEQLVNSSNGRERAEGERQLRAAVVDYARAQHGQTIAPSAFPRDWGLRPAAYDADASLTEALKTGELKAWLSGQPPALPAYQALQEAYVAYLKIDAAGGWPAVTATPLVPGLQGLPVAALRRRLAFEDRAVETNPDAPVDASLIAALQRFQAAHGLVASGELDAATLEQLNVPAAGRAAQIRASLERLRWLARQEPATRIDVNIAAAEMDYYVDGQLATRMLAVSGRPGDETPMLASAIDSIVLNPPWTVPEEIAREEILPKGRAYLRRRGFSMRDGRLVQRPGPDAALGLVKFDFDNPYAVYLHDTPAKAAFASTQRAVSHGCVRLAQAVELARTLLSSQPGWSAARVDQTLAAGETTRIALDRPVPVRLIYLTAFPEGGRIAFRPDIYGWDAQLLRMLDATPKPAGDTRRADGLAGRSPRPA